MSGTVYEDVLARLPDNEATRSYAKLSDYAGIAEFVDIERPGPGADQGAVESFYKRLVQAYEQGFGPDFPAWPQQVRDYISFTDWYPYVAFDVWSANQSASAGDAFVQFTGRQTGGPRLSYDIALGEFDPGVTADALASCECDQPTTRSHDGVEYYSWGPEIIGQIERRHGPPMYDHVGRGPRVLVRDGEAYYSIANAAMEHMIDVLDGNAPSLADDPAYIQAARRLAGLGLMRNMTFYSSGFSLEAAMATTNEGPLFEEVVQKTDLFLPFDMVATGSGFDGERGFTGFVISNPDEATAERNAEIFIDRLRKVPVSIRTDGTKSEQVQRLDITVDGNFIVAQIYFHDVRQYQFGFPVVINDTWLIHE